MPSGSGDPQASGGRKTYLVAAPYSHWYSQAGPLGIPGMGLHNSAKVYPGDFYDSPRWTASLLALSIFINALEINNSESSKHVVALRTIEGET
jgi:hypothetical protein